MPRKDAKKKMPMSKKPKPPMRKSPKEKEPMDDKDKNHSIRIAIMMAKEMPGMVSKKGKTANPTQAMKRTGSIMASMSKMGKKSGTKKGKC